MKWTRETDAYGNPKGYVSGCYRIRRQSGVNIFTSRPMADQCWDILKDNIKIDYAVTLKDAKAMVEAFEKETRTQRR